MADIDIAVPDEAPHALFLRLAARGEIALDERPTGGHGSPPRRRLPDGASPPPPAATTGRVVSITRVFGRATDHLLALIDLDPGGRLLARLTAAEPDEALIGRAVRLKSADERVETDPFLTFVTCEAER